MKLIDAKIYFCPKFKKNQGNVGAMMEKYKNNNL